MKRKEGVEVGLVEDLLEICDKAKQMLVLAAELARYLEREDLAIWTQSARRGWASLADSVSRASSPTDEAAVFFQLLEISAIGKRVLKQLEHIAQLAQQAGMEDAKYKTQEAAQGWRDIIDRAALRVFDSEMALEN